MTSPPLSDDSVAGGFDGWAVLDLASVTVVQANDRGRQLLGLSADALPAPLADMLPTTDRSLLLDRVMHVLRAGDQWEGGMRLGGVDLAPSSVLFVPHLTDSDAFTPEFASVLFSSNERAGPAALVLDPLTGLPTRSGLLHRLEQALVRNRESTLMLGTFFVDLDGLKKINDRYGHEVGDTVLIETAQRISANLPAGAVVVRFGGDEFVIVHEELETIDEAVSFAERIVDALNEVGDYHAISASIGVALARTGEVNPQELLRRSDAAMYQAKARGGAQVAIFDAQMRERQRDDETLRTSLLDAISNNGFGVAAQPIYELASGRISGVELFIRLRDDSPYVTNANQLFRFAHEYGEAFDAAVLGRAVALAQVWHQQFGEDAPRLHINISNQSMAAPNFSARVQHQLRSHHVLANRIAFEFDGRDLAAAGDRERSTVSELAALGVPIVVDGFGRSTLTLPELDEWRPSMVKIDANSQPLSVTAGLVRGVTALRVPATIKAIGSKYDLDAAVAIGAFGGQGNALTPVRRVEHVDSLLQTQARIGF